MGGNEGRRVKDGPGAVHGAVIEGRPELRMLNPDWTIASMGKKAKLEMKRTIRRGRG